mmetsp:Transcript_12157/g.24805  ORF Transcript_12157/g.24805 Transcript_12157/m.24805 type:complete len:207 (+) Transcript_12157:118-738(+)
MADLYIDRSKLRKAYRDRHFKGSAEEYDRLLSMSTTLYVGNLSFYTTEEQIWELFSKAGPLKRIIMGLDRNQKTPCGFCFVEYITRKSAQNCHWYISGTRLDDRLIRADWDYGFEDGRQFGRGRSGGQVRDEYRTDFDPARGGLGRGHHNYSGVELWGPPAPGPSTMQVSSGQKRPRGGTSTHGSEEDESRRAKNPRFHRNQHEQG